MVGHYKEYYQDGKPPPDQLTPCLVLHIGTGPSSTSHPGWFTSRKVKHKAEINLGSVCIWSCRLFGIDAREVQTYFPYGTTGSQKSAPDQRLGQRAHEAQKPPPVTLTGSYAKVVIGPDDLKDYVGPPPFTSDRIYETTPPGVVMGLAWTSMGGNSLYVEAAGVEKGEGKGSLKTTGQHLLSYFLWTSAALHSGNVLNGKLPLAPPPSHCPSFDSRPPPLIAPLCHPSSHALPLLLLGLLLPLIAPQCKGLMSLGALCGELVRGSHQALGAASWLAGVCAVCNTS